MGQPNRKQFPIYVRHTVLSGHPTDSPGSLRLRKRFQDKSLAWKCFMSPCCISTTPTGPASGLSPDSLFQATHPTPRQKAAQQDEKCKILADERGSAIPMDPLALEKGAKTLSLVFPILTMRNTRRLTPVQPWAAGRISASVTHGSVFPAQALHPCAGLTIQVSHGSI